MNVPTEPTRPPATSFGRPLTDAVRASCAAVADRARLVRLQVDGLTRYCDEIAAAVLTAPAIDPAYHVLADPATSVAYFLTLDSINFGSGYFPTMRKRPGLSGYFTVALSLKEAFDRDGPWSAQRLAKLSAADCAATFGQPPEFPLMALFAQALRDLGRLLLAGYDGDPMALIAAAGDSAERFAELLTAMPFYRDVAAYDGQQVAFYKRAQLAAADLALAVAQLPGYSIADAVTNPVAPVLRQPLFADLDRLTIFADNLVPHVLRVDGVLQYDADLLARINAEHPIPSGSVAEVEIRACAVHAVELLKAELVRRGVAVTSSQLDYFLWTRGGGAQYKAQPRHRSPGVYY